MRFGVAGIGIVWIIAAVMFVVMTGEGSAPRSGLGRVSIITTQPSAQTKAMPHALFGTRKVGLFWIQQKTQRPSRTTRTFCDRDGHTARHNC